MTDRTKVEEAWKATQFDNLEKLKELVPEVVGVNASTFNPENHVHSLLMCATAHGSIKCANYLIENNVNVNAKNFAGYSALHWAAYTGREETLQLLLDNQVDIESRTEDGKTALHIASLRGHIDFVKLLLEKNADLNAVACNGWTALHFAIVSNQKPLAKFLIEQKIDTEEPDSNGKTINDLAEKYERTWFSSLIQHDE